jgi:GlnD PII-uridylyltransferase
LDHLESLLERAEELGSWRRRYVYNIQKGLPGLVSRLEQHGKLEEVKLWTASSSVATEIEAIMGLGRSRKDRLSDLGCYFALQILQQNLGSLAVLRFQVRTSDDRHPVYHRFLRRSGDAFETLVAAYAGRVLQIFLGDAERPEFVLCAVGTRYHQDDVDIGVIDDGSASRINLHRAVGRLSNEMLRRASEAHLYISEHVGRDLYCASIPEYHELLDRQIQDFIVIGEMLAARPLIGSRRLFESFRRQITSRYIFQTDSETRFHEGYLRGILGEIRSLRLGSVSSQGIHLKNDGLRLIQSLVFAMRTVAGVSEPDLLKSLLILREVRPEYRTTLKELERTLVFLETFRLLYQLLVGEQEDVPLLGPRDFASLRPIAEAMGYSDSGPVSAEQTVLVRWLENVEKVRELTDRIVPVIAAHFSRISTVLRRLAPRPDQKEATSSKGNLALDLAEIFEFQRGTRYWDDLLEALEADDCLFLRALVEDLGRLSDEDRAGVIDEIARWCKGSFVSGIRLLLILKKHGRKVGDADLFDELAAGMIGMMDGSPDEQRRLAIVFRRYPQLVSPFVLALQPDHVKRLEEILEGQMIVENMAPWRDRLVILAGHSRRSSRYFKRYLERVTERLPLVSAHLEEPAELHILAKGLLADAELTETRSERDRLLGEFYDIEFLRGGLSTLAGTPHSEIGDSFTRFTDQFVEAVFDLAKQEIEDEEGEHRDLHDLLAVYTTGGHARGQAYDDDYDLLAILDSNDPGDLVYANWLVSRLNRKLVRRGLIPHHRCVDWIGRFIVTFDDLREHLDSDEPDIFIDQCQLLGARRVVGSRVFEERLQRRVLETHIFQRSRGFLTAVRREVVSRREDRQLGDPRAMNIKEDPGGLREIEMTALASKAVLGLRGTSASETLNRARVPWLTAHRAVDALFGIMGFLNHVRAGYRLTVAASDVVELDQLDDPARIVGEGKNAGARLALKLQSEMARASRAVDEVLATLAETDPENGVVPLRPPVQPSGG